MSLSADKHAAVVKTSEMPEMLTPLFGRNAEQERDELKEIYPEFVPGKRQVIPASDLQTYLYCMSAESYWKTQKELAQNRMRFYLGDAEYGTDEEGEVLVSRRMAPRAGYIVDPGTTDSINSEK